MATAARLSVAQLASVLATSAELRLSMVFLLSRVDPGDPQAPALQTEYTLASALVKALGCDHTLVDFASIPRPSIEKRAAGLDFCPPDAKAPAERRKPTDAEVGRCLRAWDFALEVSCIPVDAAPADVKPPVVSISKTIKLSAFISSDLEGTAPLLSSEEVATAEALYKDRLGILPQEAAMPSEEQLAGLKFVLINDMTPYVDFALWGPFNRRFIRRKSALVSFTPDVTDGTWRPSHKLTGPASFEAWLSDWIVFRTAMVMLEGAEPERLDQYAGFIRELHEKHTARCWWLIYQADTRLRSERLGRISRASSSDDTPPTCTKRRWSNAFTKAIDMESSSSAEFWNNEVHRPASEFKSGLASHQDLAKDGTSQWLQPQGSPNKRRRGRGDGSGYGNANTGGNGSQTAGGHPPQPAWWDHQQPPRDDWNVWPAKALPKDGGKGKPKDKAKGGPKGRGVPKGKGSKGKTKGTLPPPPPVPATAPG
jgi:hypothetical protein